MPNNNQETLFNIFIGHNFDEIKAIEMIYKKYDCNAIIEFGTWYGGLSSYLILLSNGNYIGFDYIEMLDEKCKKLLKEFNAEFYCVNLKEQIEIVSKIIEKFILNKRVLFYIDNGDKLFEINTYAGLIKAEDIIIAHDFETEWNLKNVKGAVQINEELIGSNCRQCLLKKN